MSEREVLLEQLEELLEGEVVDEDDAIEIAVVAGLAARLGADVPLLGEARAWRDGLGKELIDRAFEMLDPDELVEGIEGVLEGDADEEAVEEALFELDDLVAAAAWTGHLARLRPAAKQVAETIRMVPEPFAALSDYGVMMAREASVAQEPVYDYWLAVADAGQWKEESEKRG